MTKRSLVLSLALSLVLVGCSTEMDDLRVSDEQENRMAVLYEQANAQLDTEPTKAIRTAHRILESAEILEYRARIGDAHYLMGIGYDLQGKYDSAAYHHITALQERRELDDETRKAKSYVNLGIVYLQLGLIREARDCQETAIAIWEKLSNQSSEANAYRNLGLIEQEDKRYDQAEAAYRHSLRLHQQLGNQTKVARLYNDLVAVNELKESNDSKASDSTVLAYYQQALRLSSTDDGYALGLLLGNIGRSYNRLHQPDSGLAFLRRSETILTTVPLETLKIHTLVGVYNGIADSYIQKVEFGRAIEMLEKAERLDKLVTGPFRREFLDTYQLFQSVYSIQKNTTQVRHYQKKYQAIQAQLAHIKNLAEIVQLRSQVQVKNLEKSMVEKRQREIESMNNFMTMLVIPTSLALILICWRHVKQNRRIKMYRRVLRAAIPKGHFEIDDEDED